MEVQLRIIIYKLINLKIFKRRKGYEQLSDDEMNEELIELCDSMLNLVSNVDEEKRKVIIFFCFFF
jgi:hypothetical protein